MSRSFWCSSFCTKISCTKAAVRSACGCEARHCGWPECQHHWLSRQICSDLQSFATVLAFVHLNPSPKCRVSLCIEVSSELTNASAPQHRKECGSLCRRSMHSRRQRGSGRSSDDKHRCARRGCDRQSSSRWCAHADPHAAADSRRNNQRAGAGRRRRHRAGRTGWRSRPGRCQSSTLVHGCSRSSHHRSKLRWGGDGLCNARWRQLRLHRCLLL